MAQLHDVIIDANNERGMTIWNIAFCRTLNNKHFEVISRGARGAGV
jgi:hypothetical protein